MWGKAIYFAVNANYSCPEYSYKVPGSENEYDIFCANVVVGKSIEVVYKNGETTTYKEPPMIEGTNNRADSVKGNTNNRSGTNSDVYMVN
jgi:hypothetical protein